MKAAIGFRESQWVPRGFRDFLAHRINHFLQCRHSHIQNEEKIYFPMFRLLDRAMVADFDLLKDALLAPAGGARTSLDAGPGTDPSRRAANAYATEACRLLSLLLRTWLTRKS
ncbi:hypothetical protein ACGGKE_05080 [Sphingobium naphthae]|uniref:hypothetical protein n=1 Tax=Sphingobium naphthae TaxID=1886786 RepID=UPI003747A666